MIFQYGRPAAVQLTPATTPPAHNRPAQTGDALLLLIDNDPAILEGMVALLEDWDYQTPGRQQRQAALTHSWTPTA